MILYFADRNLNILLTASTDLPEGVIVKDDLKTKETETGVSTFSGVIGYADDTTEKTAESLKPGNYVFRQNGESYELYTIITSEDDNKAQDVEFYAEDGGLELLNNIALKWPDNDEIIVEAKTLTEYFTMFLNGTEFEIGINESTNEEKLLAFDQEHTVANRLLVIAQEFDCEIDYSFKVEGFKVTKKQVNVYKKKGGDFGVQWRMNKEIDRIVTKATAENLASAFLCYGSIPDGANLPITLADFTPTTPTPGYTIEKLYYADRDDWGYCLCSDKALHQWGTSDEDGGLQHVVKVFNYDTLSQDELYKQALAELQRVENVEYNWEVEVSDVRDARLGDTIYIVDETGKLYLSARLLKLEESVSNRTKAATLGDYVIQDSGISEKIRELAEQFAFMVVPQITVERDAVSGTTTITATDKNGTTTATIYDGEDGSQGPPGADGADGADAPTIVSVIPQWCMSSTRNSFTKATGYDWQDTMPAYVSGLYYYTRTKTTYSSGNPTYSTPVLDLSAQVSAESSAAASAAASSASDAQIAAEAAAGAAGQAASDAETARNTAVNTANQAKSTADGVAKHFWYDDSGAHVSDVENSVASGNSITISSSAIAVLRNGKLVTSWTGSSSSDAALNFYDCTMASARDADIISSYARSGITLYSENKRAFSLVSSGLTFWDPTDTTNAGTANQRKEAVFAPASVNLYANGYIAANFAADSLNFYDGSAASASADNLLAAYSKAGITMYSRYSGASKNTRVMSLTASGLTFWDPSDTTNSGTANQRKEAVFGASGVTLYVSGNQVASFGQSVELVSLDTQARGTRKAVLSGAGLYLTNGTTNLAGIGFVNSGSSGYPEGGYLDLGKGATIELQTSAGHLPSGATPDVGAMQFYTKGSSQSVPQFALGILTDQTVCFGAPNTTFVAVTHTIFSSKTFNQWNVEADSITLTKSGNYFPIGIIGYDTGSGDINAAQLYLSSRSVGSATLSYIFKHIGSNNARTVTVTVTILWVRTSTYTPS